MLTNEYLRDNTTANCVEFMRLAAMSFESRLNNIIKANTYLNENKPFKLGQVVMVKDYFRENGEIVYVWKPGIVISHGIPDGHDDYYRIYFDVKKSFKAVRDEADIRVLTEEEEIPEDLKEYTFRWAVGNFMGIVRTIQTFKSINEILDEDSILTIVEATSRPIECLEGDYES